ncbi:MAG: PEGA domain-containing protein [Spirochaetales bacterium]|nr:PEGA domain-containing protein [Spirochaetales bacterium]
MKVKRIAIALLVFFVAGVTVFAQTGTSGSGRSGSGRYVLTIESNVRGAQVFVNAVLQKGVAPMQLTLAAGSYSITVRANGYRDYTANVNLTRDVTLNANLQPITYTLTVTSSIRESTVSVDGQARGRAPVRLSLPQGNYTVKVEASGHHPFVQLVNVTSDFTVNAQLQPVTFRLNVTSNVQGADVYLGGSAVGKAPLQIEVTPGTYVLLVSAPGYGEFTQVINMQENFNINVNLRKQIATVTLSIPQAFLNPAEKDPFRLFTLYVDGRRIAGSLSQPFEVEAGQRSIRVETGGIVFNAVYVIEPGKEYVLELNPVLLLSPVPEIKPVPGPAR